MHFDILNVDIIFFIFFNKVIYFKLNIQYEINDLIEI